MVFRANGMTTGFIRVINRPQMAALSFRVLLCNEPEPAAMPVPKVANASGGLTAVLPFGSQFLDGLGLPCGIKID